VKKKEKKKYRIGKIIPMKEETKMTKERGETNGNGEQTVLRLVVETATFINGEGKERFAKSGM